MDMRRFSLVLLVAIAACATSPRAPSWIRAESWGGEHVLLTATDTGAALEFDCAAGSITEPLRLDTDGTFSWGGTYIPGHGGPIRIDEVPDVRPATYSGRVIGSRMTLEMRTNDGSLGPFTYELQEGGAARVFKCL